ncbi:hypothetical protein B0T14DRAFT_510379 [Immersiella caudata]|uniref:DNA (cytosine-5)-methyltransferase 1 replication foci domain-containing protein n=1 Tax=Immersiella caudata TaxID=314043 RepID=A0AA40C6C0_9PEZI|nr:hypothetical protein B0T14DRAFT_510379 [Immersiella caudata]
MGRPRKASTSTVATVDKVRFPWQKETSVLKSAPEGMEDDELPIFTLYDAVVYEKDGRTLGNPLFVDKVGPMVVRGRVERDDFDEDQISSLLIKPNMRTANIEIPASTRYAIGFLDHAQIWVFGAAGWYEIRPAPEFEVKYLEICEAITLYYEALFVVEHYNKKKAKKQKKSHREPTHEDIFFKYAVGAGDGVTRDEVEARYRRWAAFFVSHFSKENDVIWEGTLFAKWAHEVVYETKKGSATDAGAPVASERASSFRRATLADEESQNDASSARRSRSKSAKARQRDSNQDVEMTGVPSPQVQQLAIRKGKSIVETPVPLPPQYRLSQLAAPTPSTSVRSVPVQSTSVPITPAPTTPVDVLLDVLNEIATGRDLTNTKASTVHTQIYMLCKIRPYKAETEVTAFYAKELLPRLPAVWKDTGFYKYLRQASREPLVLELTTADKIPDLCQRRNKAAERVSRAPRSRSNLPQSQDFSDSGEDAKLGERARRSGKAAGLRLTSSSKKRPASEIDLDGEPVAGRLGGKKSAKLSHGMTEDDEDSSSSSDSESVLNTDDDYDKTSFFVSPPPDAVKVVVTAERIPTMSPTGPNGTWVCDQEGCHHIVRAANKPLGQELVRAHFQHHEAQAERVTLAVKESRGQLPINHLLDKIQDLGKKAMEKQSGASNGEEAPAPFKRRLLL